MMNFKEFNELRELDSLSEVKLLHLEHLEDDIINLGLDGAKRTLENVQNTIDYLKSNSGSDTHLQIKVDGSPAIIAGYLNDKFFVSTKSLFNKTPKICYSEDDIKKFFKPELQKILSICLKYLPEVIPAGAIYQGDYLFSKDTINKITINGKKYYTFKPNTILYAIEANSNLGKYISTKEIGIAFHTEYIGTSIETLNADVLLYPIKSSKNVYAFSTTVEEMPVLITDEQYKNIQKTIKKLYSDMKKFNKSDLMFIASIKNDIKAWINYKIKLGSEFNDNVIKDLVEYLNKKHIDKLNKLKTDKGKEKRNKEFKEYLAKLRKVSGTIYYMIFWRNEIVKIKHIILEILDKFSEYQKTKTFLKTSDGYKITKPEGYVVITKSGMIKFVNRLEFSAANFNARINEAEEFDQVVTFGRMNPFTKGHETNINYIKKLAKEHNAEPILILSKTEDNDKNPLSYKTKLQIAKKIFNIKIEEDKSIKNIFQYVDFAKKNGIKSFIFVVGDDRINDFKNLISYGKKNDINIKIVSSGQRTKGISGTDMRNYIRNDDFELFFKNAPSKLSKSDARIIFDEIKYKMEK